MGNLLSTGHGGVEEVTSQASGMYKYPPTSGGSFFANHFIMGGEKFDSPQPEAFLFGENADLNFLGGKPVPFPYPPPQPNEPTKTLRSLINIRRDSLHFVAAPVTGGVVLAAPEDDNLDDRDPAETVSENGEEPVEEQKQIEDPRKKRRYNIQFTFDSDVRCAITIYYFCTEEIGPQSVTYTPRESSPKSETYYYKRGASQVFQQTAHVFQPGKYPETWLTFGDENTNIPIAIHCVSMEGDAPRQSHTTFGIVERSSDGGYILKAFKQKLFVDGLSYLLQEIYGLENKSTDTHPNQYEDDDDDDDCGADCVVCMCDLRDTIILPCRHLCLCFACAESLRYQANNCPICRAPFIALLQIRAVQRINHATHPALAGTEPGGQDGVPQGYQAISLVEALNGPGYEPPPPTMPVLSLAGPAESRPSTSSGGKKSSRSKRRSSQDGRSKYCRSHSSTSPTSSTVPSEDPLLDGDSSIPSSSRPETSQITLKNTVELKIVNEVGSSDLVRASNSRPLTPPSLDIVEEELAKLGRETDVDDVIGTSSQKLLHNDDDEFDEDDLDAVPPTTALVGSTSVPGTPMSGASVRSSQDSSSSATSTRQLLPPQTATTVTSSSTSINNGERKATPVTVTFTPSATIVKVVPSDADDDLC